ncbi:MAG: FecR domain-containing protein [Bacteroidota bacterium]
MNEMDINQLLKKYESGECTPEESAFVESWYNDAAEHAEAVPVVTDMTERKEMTWNALHVPEEAKVSVLWKKIAVAAAVAAIALCVWLFNAPKGGRHLEGSVATRDLLNDIAPGKNGATITLANGKVIELSGAKKGVIIGNGKLVYDDKTPLSPGGRDGRSPERGMLTAETRKGQVYEFTLPDGTHVWLNADSKISFPSQFNGKERKILLSGEAYFAVVHNAKQPFRVESNGQVVEDIGTEFNISAYGDEINVKTTLVEGSAKVTPLSPQGGSLPQGERGAGSITLKANQQAILSPLEGEMPAGQRGVKKLHVTDSNTEEAIAWKNGYFRFNDQKITAIMLQLSRWYDIEVKYEGTMTDEGLYGKISRYKNISDVLKMLEKTGLLHFKVEGRRVTVLR